ncbi:hypothetical protein Ssi03_20050 [Sphaerisporangium siamense]|uniref:Putative RNase H-like HicB family nuclease n=1 Tax=Sphaerisporangium siamense TaxID=795645 RepID=A0A7W7DE92_9ACTN|nr:DUF6461 domain-containing protein [Sphaerisporangium siamense]MBB4705207.1 putative RNase H-like HicB family nuclease [Sphaerisporangium siamense]GII84015.1 hypothetical protein Ssi03_20050 [Sphaerisporangium siamense]
MSGVTLDGYDWFSTRELGFCLTFVRGLTPEEAFRRIGVEVLSEDEEEDEDVLGGVLRGESADGGALLVEENGYAGTMDELLRPLSAGTAVASVFRNADFDQTFVYYEDGREILGFDPQFPGDSRSGADPDRHFAEMRDLGLIAEDGEDGPETGVEAALALAERLTGVRAASDDPAEARAGLKGVLPDY